MKAHNGAKKSETLPIRVLYNIWSFDTCQLVLTDDLNSRVGMTSHWPNGITPDVVDFLIRCCRCAHCSAPILLPIGRCSCGEPEDDFLSAAYDRIPHHEEYRRLFRRETSRGGRRRRAVQLALVGGSHSRKQTAALLVAQENSCYYCLDSLIDSAGRPRFHADHYVPLAEGGSNGIENIVLACARCNLKKSNMKAVAFGRKSRIWRDPSQTEKLRRIRRQVKALRPSLVEVERLQFESGQEAIADAITPAIARGRQEDT